MIKTDTARWLIAFAGSLLAISAVRSDQPQYEFKDIRIPQASGEESTRSAVSVDLAMNYLEKGALAWSGHRKCVSCHTNGTYMFIRPALSKSQGKPSAMTREFFVDELKRLQDEDPKKLTQSTRPAQVIYIAAGLSEWDAQVTQSLSAETAQALELMFRIQLPSGTWGSLDCWPPYESDAYHEATVAAMAVATAPGWLEKIEASQNLNMRKSVGELKQYLRTQPAPHDYGRMLLLWASTRMPDLLDAHQEQQLIELIATHQRPDGGWSIRTFAAPEEWGRGNRAEKLRGEQQFSHPLSDGHATGLAIITLRSAGVPANDLRLQRGITWLKTNQRESGRWWTQSLNTDSWHFITYSGTAFPMLALQMCDSLPN